MAPNISIRESIRWLPDPASEPTRTVVVTSAENRYVDLRILSPEMTSEARPQDTIPLSRVDWAIAGTSSSEVRKDRNGKSYVHSTWHHWIDSRTRQPEEATDEGDMFPLEGTRTLEKGSMVNPATGELTDYEEVWVDEEPMAVRSGEGRSGNGWRVCVVLDLCDDEKGMRGLVVRVGQYVQALFRHEESVELEQWTWTADTAKWKRTCKVGRMFLPCNAAMEDDSLEVGGKICTGSCVWRVTELSYI